ncbi:MAG: ABC transporter substrate-binding protein [Proteobacteria bacterium]|nr:ABC transporter substrate-binding protein [Pseudomonadota bacterium]
MAVQDLADDVASGASQPGGPRTDFRDLLLLLVPAVAAIALAIWFLLRFVQPSPPTHVVIATGGQGGAYYAFAKRYAEILARSGITLEVRSTGGSIENARLLADPASGVDLALMQGGITNTRDNPSIVSLGRAFIEPLWVFYRGSDQLSMLSQLKGRRIAVGPEGSGTRQLAMSLLAVNEIDAASATLVPITGKAASDALVAGDVDAIFLAMAPESEIVQGLVRNAQVRTMSFAQAEAYARRLPFLQRITLPQGSFDLARNVPASDVTLVAPVAAVVARDTLHPAIAGLIVDAMRDVHGRGSLFQRFGEFPQAADPEFEVPDNVERYYKAGPSFMKRFLPFWLATFLERIVVLAVPVIGLLVPLVKGLPMLYRWRVKRRLFYWYGRLKVLERDVAKDAQGARVETHRLEIDRIDGAVGVIPVPLGFSEEYYSLRSAIDLVRQRVIDHASRVHPNLT